MSAVSAGVLHRLITAHGGFTLDPRTGENARRGISLCARPSRSFTFARNEWDDGHVEAWLAQCRNERPWRSSHIGGWLDHDRVWLDVVLVLSPRMRTAACLVGRVLRQHCVFDLCRGETLRLGGGTP